MYCNLYELDNCVPNIVTPTLTFSQAKTAFEAAFLDYYGQAVGTIDQDQSQYINGAWLFNSPLWSSDGKTVTRYGKLRDRPQQKHSPYGAEFDTPSSIVPIYPG